MFSRRFVTRLSAILLAGTLAACGGAAQPLDEVAQHRQQWTSQNVANYRYTVARSCMCVEDARGPVVVEVRGDQPPTVTNVATGQQGGEFFADVDTVDELFSLIETSKKEGAAEVTITYDEKFGIPTDIKIDKDVQMADEEIYLTVSEFEAIQ